MSPLAPDTTHHIGRIRDGTYFAPVGVLVDPGEVAERSNATVLKTVRGLRPSRVQIPPPPLGTAGTAGDSPFAAHAGQHEASAWFEPAEPPGTHLHNLPSRHR